MKTATVKKECPRCGETWLARVPNPVMCPRCHKILKIADKTQTREGG